jgi:hypothetical protein
MIHRRFVRRNFIFCLFSASVGVSICTAQPMIQNPDKPLAKNAGRVLRLQEIWRTSDEAGRFSKLKKISSLCLKKIERRIFSLLNIK